MLYTAHVSLQYMLLQSTVMQTCTALSHDKSENNLSLYFKHITTYIQQKQIQGLYQESIRITESTGTWHTLSVKHSGFQVMMYF